MTQLPADYHIHTPYCGHAHGKTVDYVECAIRAGLREIGFSDHLGRYYLTQSQRRRHWDWGMEPRLLERYVRELEQLREAYANRITIRTGLEVDYVEGAEELLQPILAPYDLDFLLASIHCVPSLGWRHLSSYTRTDSWPIFAEYFKAAKAAIRSGLFDSLAHLDFVWRYVKWPELQTENAIAEICETVEVAAESRVALELNANGYLWSQLYTAGEYDPFKIMIHAIRKNNVSVTLGSDAHKPEFVGKAFPELVSQLRDAGVRHYCTFKRRKPIPQNL